MAKAKALLHSDLNVILEIIYLFGTIFVHRLVAINCEDFKSLLIKLIPFDLPAFHSCKNVFVYIAGFGCSRLLLCSRFIWQSTATKGGTFHRDLDSGGGGFPQSKEICGHLGTISSRAPCSFCWGHLSWGGLTLSSGTDGAKLCLCSISLLLCW